MPTAASAACVGVEQGDHGHAEQRDGAAEGLIAEAEQIGERASAARDHHHLHATHGNEVGQCAHDRRSGVAVLHWSEAPHQPPRPAASGERREDVVARLAALAGDHADRAGKHGPLEELLGLEQSLGVQLLAQPVDARQQIALAGDAHVGDGEGEAGRGGGAAGVVVATSRHHDLHALRGRCTAARDHRLPIAQPGRAGDRAGRVAQLEVHARTRWAQVHELAHDLHAGHRAELFAQRRGVLADGKRAG
jgi:hypothetical protein